MTSARETADKCEAIDSGRRWARYPVGNSPIVVTAGDLQFQAVVIDESIGGLGIRTEESVSLMEGQTVELLYHGADVCGQISKVIHNEQGGCRISVSWEEKEPTSADNEQMAFLKYGPLSVICKTKPHRENEPFIITLWDGKQFEVASDRLTFRTKRARLVELQRMGQERDMTARLYGLDTQGSPHAVTNRIIEFETRQR